MTLEHTRDARHFKALDGLRGFAALLVVISHAANSGYLPSVLGKGFGQMGVILFFGLSGFLMAYLYVTRRPDATELKNYAINRFSRVAPLFYAVLMLTAVTAYLFDVQLLPIDSTNEFLLNLFLVEGSSILWTVPVEIQFYFVFAGIWLAAYHGFLKRVLLGLVIVQAAILLPLLLAGYKNDAFLPFWLHVFLFGVVLGSYHDQLAKAYRERKLAKWLIPLAWVILIAVILAPPEVRRLIGMQTSANYRDLFTVGYPMMLLLFSIFGIGPFRFFALPILAWYGGVSYSLYMLHMIVLVFVEHLVSQNVIPAIIGFPTLLGLATLAAWLSHRFFERPMQTAAQSFLRRRLGVLPTASLSTP